MAAITSQSPCINHLHRNPISLYLSSSSSPAILSFPYHHLRFCALKSRPDARNASSNSSQDGLDSDMLRKPVVSPALDAGNFSGKESDYVVEDGRQREEEGWVDWEDQILEDTVPLVGFIGYHPDFESSRCLFIVRKDGELVDFSYWKCLKGLIRKNYPLYADSFILRHFRRRRRSD
ncbi:hypothetical protein RJ639_037464 [Escallonia herrerae]|uniref:Uncharacterized protein n=1 Tax=Escallonia herrerae TaxID=1293975 RepID=A0AA88WIK0_9ASTE|nr:hypothetical protein RJ639_037464 [Escallonia herrerae]